MNEMLFNETQEKQEISHLRELKYFHNMKLCFSPTSLKDIFYNHLIFWPLYGSPVLLYLPNREKKKKSI